MINWSSRSSALTESFYLARPTLSVQPDPTQLSNQDMSLLPELYTGYTLIMRIPPNHPANERYSFHFSRHFQIDYCLNRIALTIINIFFRQIAFNPRHPSFIMAPGAFKKPLPHKGRIQKGKKVKNRLTKAAVQAFTKAMDIVLSQDPSSRRAVPWDTPGRTGITVSFPDLRLDGDDPGNKTPRRPPTPPIKGDKPRKNTEPDMLQKLLDGQATPQKLRDAESSTYVPDEVLEQAAEQYEHEQAAKALQSIIPDHEETNSLFDDEFFETDPFWPTPSTSTPNTSLPTDSQPSQILRGDGNPQEDLTVSGISTPSTATGDQIMQAAMNSISGVADPPGHLPPQQLLEGDPPPTRDITPQKTDSSSPFKGEPSKSSPGRSASAKVSKYKRRIYDTDSEDSLHNSKPNEKSRRLSDDDEAMEDDDIPPHDSFPPLGKPAHEHPAGAAPPVAPNPPTKGAWSTKKQIPNNGSTPNKGPTPPPRNRQNGSPPRRTGTKGSSSSRAEHGQSRADASPTRSKPQSRENNHDHRDHDRSEDAGNNTYRGKGKGKKSKPRKQSQQEEEPSISPTPPRTLQEYQPTPDHHDQQFDTSGFRFELGKLLSDARYRSGHEVATSAGTFAGNDPLIKSVRPGSYFSAADLRPAPVDDPLDTSTLVKLPDFPGYKGAQIVSIKTKGVIPFVLLSKAPQALKWSVPTLDEFDDFMNLLQCSLIQNHRELLRCIQWSNRRGHYGIFGLATDPLDRVHQLRNIITTKQMDGLIFTSYPHALAAKRYELTSLLKANHKAIDVFSMPTLIFLSNEKLNLQGSLECDKYRTFTAGTRSKQGELKTHWRLALLSADEDFMKSIKHLPQSQLFRLGTGSVQIRGGERAPEPRRQPPPPHQFQSPSYQGPSSSSRGRGSRGQDRNFGNNNRRPRPQDSRRSRLPDTEEDEAADDDMETTPRSPRPSGKSASASSSKSHPQRGSSHSRGHAESKQTASYDRSRRDQSRPHTPEHSQTDNRRTRSPSPSSTSAAERKDRDKTRPSSTPSTKESDTRPNPMGSSRRKVQLVNRPFHSDQVDTDVISTSAIRKMITGKNKNTQKPRLSERFSQLNDQH